MANRTKFRDPLLQKSYEFAIAHPPTRRGSLHHCAFLDGLEGKSSRPYTRTGYAYAWWRAGADIRKANAA